MDRRVAVLAEALEVVERERHMRVVDVLRRQVDLVVDHLRRTHDAVGVAAFAEAGRNHPPRGVDDAPHVCLAVAKPCGTRIELLGPILRHLNHVLVVDTKPNVADGRVTYSVVKSNSVLRTSICAYGADLVISEFSVR